MAHKKSGSGRSDQPSEPKSKGPRLQFWDPDLEADDAADLATAEPADPAGGLLPTTDHLAAQAELTERLKGIHPQAATAPRLGRGKADARNILGYAVGAKFTDGRPTRALAVKVYVRKKVPMTRVQNAARVIPTIAGYPTDVVEIGAIKALALGQALPRPVTCGAAIALEYGVEQGTLGCVVVLADGCVCLMSNNHVIANLNQAAANDPIVQPGGANDPNARIGTLRRWITLNLDPASPPNTVDVAAALTTPRLVTPLFPSFALGLPPRLAAVHNRVHKLGAASDHTLGEVIDLNADILVSYTGIENGRVVERAGRFVRQVRIAGQAGAPFSREGDSGSLVMLLGTNQPTGLLFAGDAVNGAFANPIDLVIQALKIHRFVSDPSSLDAS